jgi:hypothetical protein
VVNATPLPLNPRYQSWVGPRAGLEGRGKSRPQRDQIPGPSSRQRVAIPTELSRPILSPAALYISSKRTTFDFCHVSQLMFSESYIVLYMTTRYHNLNDGETLKHHSFNELFGYLWSFIVSTGGTRWRSWLRHCATNRKVAGSIPDGVTGIFQ